VVVSWFATKQLAVAGVADILSAKHCYADDNGDHPCGDEPGRAAHAELLAAVLRGLRVGGVPKGAGPSRSCRRLSSPWAAPP
jgi:hypothetical protein